MITKKAIISELIGEYSVGKTHVASLPDNLIFIDTSLLKEADIIVEKNHPNENLDDIYFPCDTFREIINAVRNIKDTTKTISIDSGADLRRIGGEEWLSRNTDRHGIMPFDYGDVDNIIIKEIFMSIVKDKNKNLIVTAKMGDEYSAEKPTGRRERKGFSKMDFISDIRIHMYKEDGKRKNTVIKNRFVDEESKDYVKSLPEVTWKAIQSLTKFPPERLV